MLAYVQAGGNGGNIRAFSRKCWEVTSLYVENNNEGGANIPPELANLSKRSKENSQSGRVISLWF